MGDRKGVIMIAVLAGLMVLAPGMAGQEYNSREDAPCVAEIRQERNEQMVIFQGFVVNNTGVSLEGRYTLEAIREGASGRSVSRQGGELSLDKGKESELSRISINIDEKDEYKVILKIYAYDILMCADSIVRPALTSEVL